MKYIVECFDMQHANYAMWTVKGQTAKWETPVKMFKNDRIIQVGDTIFFLAVKPIDYKGRRDWTQVSVDYMYSWFDERSKNEERGR